MQNTSVSKVVENRATKNVLLHVGYKFMREFIDINAINIEKDQILSDIMEFISILDRMAENDSENTASCKLYMRLLEGNLPFLTNSRTFKNASLLGRTYRAVANLSEIVLTENTNVAEDAMCEMLLSLY